MTDLTIPIEASVADVEFELMLTVVLVVLVIFLFLRSLRAPISGRSRPHLPHRYPGHSAPQPTPTCTPPPFGALWMMRMPIDISRFEG